MISTQFDYNRATSIDDNTARLNALLSGQIDAMAQLPGVKSTATIGGVGGRLAMFILRLTSDPSLHGLKTDDDFTIGQVTLGGTYNLVIVGAAAGFIGAVAYVAVAPWLIGPTWFRRLTVGLTAGALGGSALIHSDGIDFNLLEGPTTRQP